MPIADNSTVAACVRSPTSTHPTCPGISSLPAKKQKLPRTDFTLCHRPKA